MSLPTNTDMPSVNRSELVNWPRVAAISAMVSFSLPTFVTGLEIYQAMTITDALFALLIGSLILTVIGAAMGTIGVRSRLSSYLLVRIAFGDKGAAIVNLAFALSLLGWFGVNIDLFSSAVSQLLVVSLNIEVAQWPIDLFAGICMIATTIFGFRAINIISTLLVPILAIVTAIMLFGALNEISIVDYLALDKSGELSIGEGVSAIVGVIIIGAIILPDITRFSKQAKGGTYTAVCAYMIVQLTVLLVTGIAAAAMHKSEILALMLSLQLGISAFFIVISGSWVLNSLNLYSTSLSIQATFGDKFKTPTIIALGVLGVIAAFFNILDMFIDFLTLLSDIFVPIAGVIIIDAFLFRKGAYHSTSLINNRAFSLPAFGAWTAGAAYSIANGKLFSVGLTNINVLDAALLTGCVYAFFHFLIIQRNSNA